MTPLTQADLNVIAFLLIITVIPGIGMVLIAWGDRRRQRRIERRLMANAERRAQRRQF